MSEDHVYIDQSWVDALGLPREEIAKLGLREFIDLCQERAVKFRVTVKDPGDQPGLHMVSEPPSPSLMEGERG